MSYLDRFESEEVGFFTEVHYDEQNEREFHETPEAIVRLSKVKGEWAVSVHAPDFFDEMGEAIYEHSVRFDDEDVARQKVSEYVEAYS